MKRVALGVVGIVVAIASGSSAAPAPAGAPARLWKITPPPGWTDASEAVRQTKEFQEQLAQLDTLNHDASLEVYQSDDGGLLHVLHGMSRRSSIEPTSELEGWERGARRAAAEDSKELSYERRFSGKVLIADATWMHDQKVYTRYTAGFDTSTRLVYVAATCVGPEASCLAATGSLIWDEASLIDIGPPRAAAPKRSLAFRIGQLVGIVLVATLVSGILLYLFRKPRRA